MTPAKLAAFLLALPETPQRPKEGDVGEVIPTLSAEEIKGYRKALDAVRDAEPTDGKRKLKDALKKGKREVLDLDKLETPQGHVRPEVVALKLEALDKLGIDNVKTLGVAARWGDRLIIVDGNHRTCAALLLKWKRAPFKVIDIG